ncbi:MULTISPECIES: hypothetical protein [Aminobacterium]|jgi:hypothetical protein|uniref:hypothetical protein n=1 Tax=Aminobacterium TaxID=81466 RepID=UPI00257E101D|nr:hypothetical protein [Aminobacterium sp. UBA4987]
MRKTIYFCREYPEEGCEKCASIEEAREIFNCDCDGTPSAYRRRRMVELGYGYITDRRMVNNYTRAIGEAFREAKEVSND